MAANSCFYDDESMDSESGGTVHSESDSTEEDELNEATDHAPLAVNADFIPRSYQTELFLCAKKKNSILVLGTGSGKTYISIQLIKEFAEQIRGPLSEGSKRTVFVVNTVPLVYQQGEAIETHTGLLVGKYEGSMGVDFWDDAKWTEELETHEVLVLTAQILLELILHARLPLNKVNVLIMDECHHAVGSHPMREIMREYESLKNYQPDECPRIMGLTASVINRKCKKNDVSKSMRDLEKTMHCALVTSINQEEVLKFTTRPKESIVMYRQDALTPYQEIIYAQLAGLQGEIDEMEDIDKKVKKFVIKRIENIVYIMKSLGDWCVGRAVFFEMENLEENAEAEEIPVVRELFQRLRERFLTIYAECVRMEMTMVNPKDHVSHQVKRLIDILCTFQGDVNGLVFVQRRNTAKILYDLLLELAKHNQNLSFVKPLYVIGANSRPSADIRMAGLELRKQKETLATFRKGEANFIVSTSVLEEGVDIRKCNVVIRFDKPMNYRAYVQSRGRARASPSGYILMVVETDHKKFINDLDVYREIEKTLIQLCHNRELPTSEETRNHFDEDEYIAPYQPYGPQGPKVTANSAIALINHYCGKLPQDKFTELAPDIIVRKNDNLKIKAGILLPINASLKDRIYGAFMDNVDLAKKSAALHMCVTLHEMGELDLYLRPTAAKNEDLLEGLLNITLEPKREGEAERGTKKRKGIYKKEVCESFSYVENGMYHLYSLQIQPVGQEPREIVVDSTKSDLTVGILCKRELVHCPFSLFGLKFGEVMVSMKRVKTLRNLSCELKTKIEHFHKVTMESLFSINTSLMEFNPREFNHGVLIVPLVNDCISEDLLNRLASRETLKTNVSNRSYEVFRFERSLYQDAVIFPMYGEDSHQMYYVSDIVNGVNPKSEFPESKMKYETYEGYFMERYGKGITNKHQPLIAAKHLPKELNYLKKMALRKKGNREPPYFIPELCGVIPFKVSLWWQLSCIPSILYRLNSFGVAYKLSIDTRVESVPTMDCIEAQPLDFKWAEKLAQSTVSSTNLAVALSVKKCRYIHPFKLVHGLTLLGTNDGFNLERLEVLGDSFLKYIAGEYVFLKYPDEHEGKLSPRRTLLVCNKTLFQLARDKSIPNKIHAVNLQPKMNGCIPGFGVKRRVEKDLINLGLSHDKWYKLQVPNNLQNLNKAVAELEREDEQLENPDKPTMKDTCYNPWKEHELSDKSVADCVEALIGAYLLQCGSDAAKDFLHWLGVGVCNGEYLLKNSLPIRSAVLKKEHWSKKEINNFYKKACLDRLEDIIQYQFIDRSFIVQAVTHSSYTQNRITDTYQRLEFIGDAVLDYLVTGLIYSRHSTYTPGNMTDMRSFYVNNETLARVAAKFGLQKHLFHMAPKLQATIDKFLSICSEDGSENELITEDDEVDIEEIEVPKCLGDMIEAIIGAVYLDSQRSLEETWRVIEILMGDVFQKEYKDIPINCVRKLYEAAEVTFTKVPYEDGSLATYRVTIKGIDEEIVGQGKNFKVAKHDAAKKGLQKLQEVRAQMTVR